MNGCTEDVVHMRLISVKEIRHTGSAGKLVDVIKYIEFDDDYMFICACESLHSLTMNCEADLVHILISVHARGRK